ncbi:MAG TPA: NADH-quinone oxidoreductase subunit B family protein [Candidatus Dormibacteraeota bacterium]
MSRWIFRGLRTGVRTTTFPAATVVGEEGAPSAVRLSWQGLTPGQALAAAATCPTAAIEAAGTEAAGELRFDAGACILCGRCTREFPTAFKGVADPRVGVRSRDQLRSTIRWGPSHAPAPVALTRAAAAVEEGGRRLFRRSLHIRHIDAGSCNGCESELQMLNAPTADLQRLGLFFTPTPRHADLLLVTGVVTSNMRQPLLDTYRAMPAPKLVVAAGACAISCGSFSASPTVVGPLDQWLPVDAYVPGCPPTPEAILHGILLALGRASERYRADGEGAGRDGA